eukprot:8740095-Pyramimonas_sp.AAC.1
MEIAADALSCLKPLGKFSSAKGETLANFQKRCFSHRRSTTTCYVALRSATVKIRSITRALLGATGADAALYVHHPHEHPLPQHKHYEVLLRL